MSQPRHTQPKDTPAPVNYRQYMDKFNEVDLSALLPHLPLATLGLIDRYQQETPETELVIQPLPTSLDFELAEVLAANTGWYEDCDGQDLEATVLTTDPVLTKLAQLQESAMPARRARRSVVVLSLLALQQATEQPPAA